MECRHCTTGDHETQDHLEKCIFFRKHRDGLDLTIRMHKLIFWRRVTRTLKDIKDNNKDSVDNNTSIIIPEHGYNDTTMGNHGSQPYPLGQGKANQLLQQFKQFKEKRIELCSAKFYLSLAQL